MIILAIDPGNAQSGWCVIDEETMKPQDFGKTDNNELLDSFERLIRVSRRCCYRNGGVLRYAGWA